MGKIIIDPKDWLTPRELEAEDRNKKICDLFRAYKAALEENGISVSNERICQKVADDVGVSSCHVRYVCQANGVFPAGNPKRRKKKVTDAELLAEHGG